MKLRFVFDAVMDDPQGNSSRWKLKGFTCFLLQIQLTDNQISKIIIKRINSFNVFVIKSGDSCE